MENLSYGELVEITNAWMNYKADRGIEGFADSGVAWEFIEEECADVYPEEEIQMEIFTIISSIEETE